MARPHVCLLLALCITSSSLAELPKEPSLEELQQLAAKEHSPKLELVELGIYPAGRKYRIRATMTPASEKPITIAMDADEKWVDGKYIVTVFQFPGAEEPTHMVVTFDGDCYRKWVFDSESIGEEMVGTRIGTTRTVSWASVGKEEDRLLVVSQETHTDTSTEWSEVHFKEKRVMVKVKGKAVVAK